MVKKDKTAEEPAEQDLNPPAQDLKEKDPKDLNDLRDPYKPKVYRPRLFTGGDWEDE